VFSVCTVFVEQGGLEVTLAGMREAETGFNREKGVLQRYFFQCETQPHIIWSLTEWTSEKHHNDAAQSIMKTRRDDRIASAAFGPDPYFEIFCEAGPLSFGSPTADCRFFVVAHGTISEKMGDRYLEFRKKRVTSLGQRFPWFGLFPNTYNSSEFVAFLGFESREAWAAVRSVEDMTIEEYLLTGLRVPMGMSLLAGFNQFLCKRLDLAG
jgi:hypothetical protein